MAFANQRRKGCLFLTILKKLNIVLYVRTFSPFNNNNYFKMCKETAKGQITTSLVHNEKGIEFLCENPSKMQNERK